VKKQWKNDTPEILNLLVSVLVGIDDFSSENVENIVKEWIDVEGLSFGKVMPPLRLVLVGDMKGPHVFDILGLIGKEEAIGRIKNAIVSLT
jgi:glutamyl-tRNA synthetase